MEVALVDSLGVPPYRRETPPYTGSLARHVGWADRGTHGQENVAQFSDLSWGRTPFAYMGKPLAEVGLALEEGKTLTGLVIGLPWR